MSHKVSHKGWGTSRPRINVPGARIGSSVLVRRVKGHPNLWVVKCECGRSRRAVPSRMRVFGGGLCKACHLASVTKPYACETCGTKDPARYGNVKRTKKTECMACARRRQRVAAAKRAS